MSSTTTTTVVTKQIKSGGATTTITTGSRDWSSGLFSCFSDLRSCICGTFCLPCLACRMSMRMGEHCCVPICVPGGIVAMRQKLRLLTGIEGSLCNDCVTFMCCPQCTACQMSREMDHAGWPGKA